jgi:hypothetical protein
VQVTVPISVLGDRNSADLLLTAGPGVRGSVILPYKLRPLGVLSYKLRPLGSPIFSFFAAGTPLLPVPDSQILAPFSFLFQPNKSFFGVVPASPPRPTTNRPKEPKPWRSVLHAMGKTRGHGSRRKSYGRGPRPRAAGPEDEEESSSEEEVVKKEKVKRQCRLRNAVISSLLFEFS